MCSTRALIVFAIIAVVVWIWLPAPSDLPVDPLWLASNGLRQTVQTESPVPVTGKRGTCALRTTCDFGVNYAEQARHLLDCVALGTFPSDYFTGGQFQNRERKLPAKSANNQPIVYREFDICPRRRTNRGTHRIVVGSDGSSYYTDDHYYSFRKL